MKQRVLVFLLMICSVVVFGQTGQEIVPIESDLYGYLDAVLKETGQVVSTQARPFSRARFGAMLDGIDPASLSPEGRLAYSRIHERLIPGVYEEAGFLAQTDLRTGLEFYPSSGIRAGQFYGYNERLPLVSIPVQLSAWDAITLYADFDVQKELFAIEEDTAPWDAVNIPSDIGYLDFQLPFRAYGSVGGSFWNVQIGRDRLAYGPGQVHNLELSGTPHFYEYLKTTFFWRNFSYTNSIIDLEPLLLSGEVARSGSQAFKTYLNHRFELRFFDRLLVAITEGSMYGGVPVTLKHLNPFMIFHSFTDWRYSSALFSVEVTVNPWKYGTVYGQMTWNQIQLAYETEVYGDDAMPSAMAFLAGTDWDIPLAGGFLDAGLEWAYTDPWMYVREYPYTSYHWRRRVFSNVRGNGTIVVESLPMGYTWGPDSTSTSLWAGYRNLVGDVAAGVHLEVARQGEQDIDSVFKTGDEAVRMRTPTGISEDHTIFRLWGSWQAMSWLSLTGGVEFHDVQNVDHQEGSASFWVTGNLGAQISIVRLIQSF